MGVVVLIIPAWRLYLLPMVVYEGWRYGFIAEHASCHLNPSDDHSVEHYLELMKHFATLGGHTVRPPGAKGPHAFFWDGCHVEGADAPPEEVMRKSEDGAYEIHRRGLEILR